MLFADHERQAKPEDSKLSSAFIFPRQCSRGSLYSQYYYREPEKLVPGFISPFLCRTTLHSSCPKAAALLKAYSTLLGHRHHHRRQRPPTNSRTYARTHAHSYVRVFWPTSLVIITDQENKHGQFSTSGSNRVAECAALGGLQEPHR